MKLISLIRLFSKISLVFTFIVVIAGSVVRMTGSGMGCPDWPKCFGYMIPPTDIASLTFSGEKSFSKGQMVILNDTLWVANENLAASSLFDRNAWQKYPKHDYATFNPLHTWVEYVNRLATVLYAIPILILSVLCLLLLIRQKDKVTFFLALFIDIMIGYEIWLGKLVVDGNLKEHSITYHMIGSIAIVSLLIVMVFRHRKDKTQFSLGPNFSWLGKALLLMTFIQVLLGTQVREDVDIVARNIDDRSLWIENLPGIFLFHRSFSILITFCAIGLFAINMKLPKRIKIVDGILILVLLEVFAGIVLNYFDMPKEVQPIHLLLGVMLFAFTFYTMLIAQFSRKSE